MDQNIRIVRAKEEDAAGICRAHKASITVLCAGHYTPREIEAWIGRREPADYLPGLRENIMLVAVARDRIAGFAEMQTSDGLIKALYVHPGHVRSGIGGTLLKCLETEARGAGWGEVRLNATLNSVSFYLNRGYTLQSEGTNMTRTGVAIPCVHMQKDLEPAAA
jgi:GNAT superfamily N-acetyltransferase